MGHNKSMQSEELKAWREALGLTQAALAQALSTPLSTYRKWEQGTRRIPGVLPLALQGLEYSRPSEQKKRKI